MTRDFAEVAKMVHEKIGCTSKKGCIWLKSGSNCKDG